MNMLAYDTYTAWSRRISCISFQNTNPIVFVMFISLFFVILYQRSYKRWDPLEIKWKFNGLWGSYSLKYGKPLSFFFKTQSNCICYVSSCCFWLTVSKRVLRALFLDITFKSVGLWGSYDLNNGNFFINIKIANQIVYFLSPALLFYLMYQNGYQR